MLFNGKGMGLVPDPPDARDFRFAKMYPPEIRQAVVKPKSSDLRPKFARAKIPILDQGAIGSCVAHAVIQADSFVQFRQRRQPIQHSRLFVYWFARFLLDPALVREDSGSSIRTGIKALATYGAPDEAYWPYAMSRVFIEPSSVMDLASHNQALSYWKLEDISEAESCIADGFPVMLALPVYENFTPDRYGRIPDPAGDVVGYHAMIAVGYGKQRLVLRNSWGQNWGGTEYGKYGDRVNQGHASISYEYAAQAFDLWTLRAVE